MGLAVLDKFLAGGAVARVFYQCGLQGRLRVTRHELKVGGLPEPLVLAFASDFHAGPTTHPELFDTLVAEVNACRPDVLLLGGDYVEFRTQYLEILSARLARCRPRFGTYAVLGNHDVWADTDQIAPQLAAVGIEVLVNRNSSLPPPFNDVSICGIDDPWVGLPDVEAAFSGASQIRVFLSHSPDGLHLIGNETFEVAFSGHTHGGQVALPDGTAIINAGGPLSKKYGRGRFEIAGNGPLIVSRGVGCSNLPVRINSDPELIVCTLVP